MADYETIDDYINGQTQEVRQILLNMKKCILKAVPDAEETLNYSIPAFTLIKNGKREEQIMMAAYKKHISLYPHPSTIENFSEKLKEYKLGKGSVQFPIDKPLPCTLIVKMIQFRKMMVDENYKQL